MGSVCALVCVHVCFHALWSPGPIPPMASLGVGAHLLCFFLPPLCPAESQDSLEGGETPWLALTGACMQMQDTSKSSVGPWPQNRAVSGLVRGLCTFINQLIEKQYFR